MCDVCCGRVGDRRMAVGWRLGGGMGTSSFSLTWCSSDSNTDSHSTAHCMKCTIKKRVSKTKIMIGSPSRGDPALVLSHLTHDLPITNPVLYQPSHPWCSQMMTMVANCHCVILVVTQTFETLIRSTYPDKEEDGHSLKSPWQQAGKRKATEVGPIFSMHWWMVMRIIIMLITMIMKTCFTQVRLGKKCVERCIVKHYIVAENEKKKKEKNEHHTY